jgi:transposase-like protein
VKTPRSKVVFTLQIIMLLEFATFLLVVQVFGQDSIAIAITQAEREKYLSAEPGVCPICGAHLQGHGWRNRYVAGLNGCFMILVHRKKCPSCKMTFTLLPKGLHSMRIYDVDTIVTAIRSFLEMGRYINSIAIEKSLRKSWVNAFLKRNSQGEAKGKDELLAILDKAKNAFLAAPLSLMHLAREEIVSRQNLERYRVPHHRLLLGLCIPSG